MKILNNAFVIELPDNWFEYKDESTNGVLSFINSINEDTGVLQLSEANFIEGKIPNPSVEELMTMSLNVCFENNSEIVVLEQKNGNCNFGVYGSACIKSKENKILKIWYLSDGKDFIIISYIYI